MDPRLAFARQFGNPSGVLGGIAGRAMAKGNAGFNTWLVGSLAEQVPPAGVGRLLELGHGPGVGLGLLLAAFPDAAVFGLDRSAAMVAQATARNRAAIDAGRLQLQRGDVADSASLAPLDLIVAVHVIYFWPDPVTPLSALRAALAPRGTVALGYLPRPHMPKRAQQFFPRIGARVYETDDDLSDQLRAAGFANVDVRVKQDAPASGGRLVLARC
jgi:trans-aconitate methyltransferase